MTHNIDVTKLDDHLFAVEKLAMANTAIGLARYYLSEYASNSHDHEEEEIGNVKQILDEYCDEVKELARQYYTYLGFDKELIGWYLGGGNEERAKEKSSWENID